MGASKAEGKDIFGSDGPVVPCDASGTTVTLLDLFDLSLRGAPEVQALEWGNETFTFGDVDARGARMATALKARGLRAGDRLCVYLPNSPVFIDLFLAALRLGVIFVPVNVLYRGREIAHILGDAEPVALVTTNELAAHAPEGARVWLVDGLAAEASAALPCTGRITDGGAAAAIVYTSGTTGASKGAVLSHNVFAVNAANITTCWRMTAADRLLLTLPLFHVHGLGNGVCGWLTSGCRMRLTERFQHEAAAQWLLDSGATLFFGVPAMYVRLLDVPAAQAREIGARMRLFVSGSAPLPTPVLEEFRVKYGHTILERYGMSETLMNLSNPYAGERRAGTVGLPLPGVEARIEEATGELLLRGGNVFTEYWRRPEATAAAFQDGWFRTGDIASQSEDGYYTLHGRRSDLIISGGFNIYPREIEEFLETQPGVAEAAVAGAPDRVRGEVPVAYIVPAPGGRVDARALAEACRAHLASFKTPRAFLEVDKLPRTALGKIQKHNLPAWRPEE